MQSLELKDVCWLEHRDLFYLTLKYATTEFRYMCYEVTFVLVKVEKLRIMSLVFFPHESIYRTE